MQRPSNILRRGARLLAAMGLLLSFGSDINGQFNGPGAGSGVQLNQPIQLTTDPSILSALPPNFTFGVGDVLLFNVFDVPQFNANVRISADGSVQLPLIGSVQLLGLTIPQAESLVAKRLIDAGMIRDPQVAIQVIESPSLGATIVGEVHSPMVMPIVGHKRLIDVLSAAGGLLGNASHIITIHRQGVNEPIVVDLGSDPAQSQQADIPIFSGDTIVVSRVGVVYVLGGLKAQGQFPLSGNSPLTMMEAVALAGGTVYDGDLSQARIIRTVGTQRSEVRVDFAKVRRGQAPDPILQPDDIVFVPTSAMKAAIKNGGLGTVIGLASLLLYFVVS